MQIIQEKLIINPKKKNCIEKVNSSLLHGFSLHSSPVSVT